jgi:hypothetical protein
MDVPRKGRRGPGLIMVLQEADQLVLVASALMRIDPSVLSKTDPPTKSAMLESYHGAIYA